NTNADGAAVIRGQILGLAVLEKELSVQSGNEDAGRLDQVGWIVRRIPFLYQIFHARLAQVRLAAEQSGSVPERRLAGLECNLAFLEFAVRIVQVNAIAALLLKVGHGLAQRRVLVNQMDALGSEEAKALSLPFDFRQEIAGAFADLGVVALGRFAQRFQGQ